jgi:hypothetical protein
MSGAWNLLNFFSPSNGAGVSTQTASIGTQTSSTPLVGIDGAAQFIAPQRLRDVVGKLKVSQSQNIYDADFEYGVQPLRWEQFIQNNSGNASIVQNPGLGGVTMTIGGGALSVGDITVRQSRPYHRYQPGKTFYMASNVNFGGAITGQFQRVGIFDDSNGIFFMQSNAYPGNPYGMYVVIRSDGASPGTGPVDQVFPLESWNGSKNIINSLDWTKVQMIWMEYAWYGAGALRWGVVVDGEPWVVHQVGTGNGVILGTSQVKPWSRTGNLPVRYEQRNTNSTALSTMTHYGVSVLIEGGIDKQRGFTYSYGNYAASQQRSLTGAVTRYPAMSFRMRAVGTDQFDNTNSSATAGTVTSLSIATATPAITSIVGSGINSQSTFTFTSAHGYTVTNLANANAPAQYINLSAFSQVGTAVAYSYGPGDYASTNAFTSVGSYTGSSGSTSFVLSNAINQSTGQPISTAIAVGQSIAGVGLPNNATVVAVTPYGAVSNVNGVGPDTQYPSTALVTVSTALTTQASGIYTFSYANNSSLLTVTSATGVIVPSATLSGTGIVSGTTIVSQKSALGTLAVSPTSVGGTIGSTSLNFSSTTGITAGQVMIGSGWLYGAVVESVNSAINITLSIPPTSAPTNGVFNFYTPTATASATAGVLGSNVITLSSVTGFVVGQLINGIGIPPNTFITAINGLNITLGNNLTLTASGYYSATAPGGNGVYLLSTIQTGTLSGNITSTYNIAAGSYLISNVPNTTQLVLNIPMINGSTATPTTATYWATNQFVGKFVYYNAPLPSLSSVALGSATLIAGVTQVPATLTFSAINSLSTGNVITISGANPAAYNGIFNYTSLNATQGLIFFSSSPGSFTSATGITSPYTGRITSNTTNTINFVDVVTGLPLANAPAANTVYQIGLIDRGQLLPQTLLTNTSQTALIELIASTPTNQLSLQNVSFKPLNTLGSFNSFAEVDLSATGLSGGEVVYAFSTPNNALQQLDLTNFFPVLTNIKGNVADILTVAITTTTGTVVQVNVVCQEAMA